MRAIRQNSVIFSKNAPKWRREPNTHTGQFFLKSDIITVGFLEATYDFRYYALSNLGDKIAIPGAADGTIILTINCEDLPTGRRWCIAAGDEGNEGDPTFYSDTFCVFEEYPEPSVFISALNRNNYDGIYNLKNFGARFPIKFFKCKDVVSDRTVFKTIRGVEINLNTDTYNIYTAIFGLITRKQAILLKYLLSSHLISIDGKYMNIAPGASFEYVEGDNSDLCYVKIDLTIMEDSDGDEMSEENPFSKNLNIAGGRWILETGYWQDANKWIDTEYWID
jgi:hypothetical protein